MTERELISNNEPVVGRTPPPITQAIGGLSTVGNPLDSDMQGGGARNDTGLGPASATQGSECGLAGRAEFSSGLGIIGHEQNA